ncbi:MAG: PF20097 family protein [Anaerostipes sp.]|nr:PF20097 family protein [Anaerostipes sp.]
MEVATMICTKCGKEMRKGYLFASKDGAFSFADEVPGVFEKADKAKGFVEITPLKAGHRTNIAAECCEECHMVVFKY